MNADGTLTFALEDHFFRKRLEEVVAERGIESIIETGLDKGLSAVVLAGMVPQYVGIDISLDCVSTTYRKMKEAGRDNFYLIQGDSARYLHEAVTMLRGPALYFLDAHCYHDTDCPILQEIGSIPRDNGVLVFHDIFVPGREHGGFFPLIEGKETRFDYELLRDELMAWSPTHRIEYLKQYSAELAPGVMFAFPE